MATRPQRNYNFAPLDQSGRPQPIIGSLNNVIQAQGSPFTGAQQQALTGAFDSQDEALYAGYQAALGNSFRAKHPTLSNFTDGLVGFAAAGPLGIGTQILAGNRSEQNRRSGLADAYKEATEATLDQGKTYLDILGSTAGADTTNAALGNMGVAPVAAFGTTPEMGLNLLKGAFSPEQEASDISAITGAAPNAATQTTGIVQGLPRFTGGKPSTASPAPPSVQLTDIGQTQQLPGIDYGDGTTSAPLVAGAQRSAPRPERDLTPYTYRNPDVVKNVQDNVRDVGNNVRNNYDDLAKLPSEISKIQAEVQEALASGDYKRAQAATEKLRPALIRAQTGQAGAAANASNALAKLRNRTNPNLRGGGSGSPQSSEVARQQQNLERAQKGVLQQLQAEGFTDGKGNLAPPSAEGGFLGFGGAVNPDRKARYDELMGEYGRAGQLIQALGGLNASAPKVANPPTVRTSRPRSAAPVVHGVAIE